MGKRQGTLQAFRVININTPTTVESVNPTCRTSRDISKTQASSVEQRKYPQIVRTPNGRHVSLGNVETVLRVFSGVVVYLGHHPAIKHLPYNQPNMDVQMPWTTLLTAN